MGTDRVSNPTRNSFTISTLAESTKRLVAVAAGRQAPDLVVQDVRVLSVYSERILPAREVWISGGRIAAVQPAGSCRFKEVSTYDGQGGLLAPGLVDAHVHIESSMITACAFAEPALLNGTTTIFCDSHEIANVSDLAGVEWMLADAREAPLNIFLTVPSTVPATHPGLETAGGDLTPEKIGALFDAWPEAVALGEKMDFIQVVEGDARSHAILAEALRRGLPVSGHIYGRPFVAAYAAAGVTDTHEAFEPEMAEDLVDAGLWLFLRGGPPTTPWNSLPQAIRAITEAGVSPQRMCLCTDDRDADDLFGFGLDWVVRLAIQHGLSTTTAWTCGSLHTAMRYGLDQELGGIGHSRRADLVLLNDDLVPRNTWFAGQLVVEDRQLTPVLEKALSHRYRYPDPAYHTVRLPTKIGSLIPDRPVAKVWANVIRLEGSDIPTNHHRLVLEPGKDWQNALREHDLCFLAVIERHGKSGRIAHGLLQRFGLEEGAVASSVGHDAHNIVIAGTNEADMRVALEYLNRIQGGVCIVRNGTVLASVNLPVTGLLSDARATEVAKETTELKRCWEKMGCRMPYMGFNLLPLSVIPEIRLTDRGLVLCPQMQLIDLFEPYGEQ